MAFPDAGGVPLPLLQDPNTYIPETIDYLPAKQDPKMPDARAWLEVFRKATPTFKAHCLEDPCVPEAEREAKAEQFASTFDGLLDALVRDPTATIPGYHVQHLSCLTLCDAREQVLHAVGFVDIFKAVKDKENGAALALLPGLLAELDALPQGRQRWEALVRGVFAGNLFDLGAAASAQHYKSNGGGASFASTRDSLVPRPWVIDHLDALVERLTSGRPYGKAVLFVDNAGSDVLLGMLPFARELLRTGAHVVLAANDRPAINDITAPELADCLQRFTGRDSLLDDALSSGRLRVVGNGSHLPVIDLRKVSPAVAAESAGADLVVLEGMGRAIETNLNAAFTVDSLKIGMIKHPEVATCLGGRLYDCVCKFQPAAAAEAR